VKIWEQKKQERTEQVQNLINRLNAIDDKQARMIAMALEYYGFQRQEMPHNAWVKIRKEVIDKAKAYLGEVAK
jgi:ABC-type phosphate transport system auxiliary subunit